MFQAREQALTKNKTLKRAQEEATAKGQNKVASREKVRAGKHASLDKASRKVRTVNAFHTPTTGESKEAAESLIKGKIKSLAMVNSTLNTMNLAARDAKHRADEQERHAEAEHNFSTAAARVQSLTRWNSWAHTRERKDYTESRAAAGPHPPRRVASANPAGRRHHVEDVFFDDFLQNRLTELNLVDKRRYEFDRDGPAFSCKAHLRHRSGHFSFALLAGLAARKKKMMLEEPSYNTL